SAAGGPSAQQAGKLETRALFAGSQGGTVARTGGNACGPLSTRLDLKAPAVPRPDTDHSGPSISPDRLTSMTMARSPRSSARRRVQGADAFAEGFRAQGAFRMRMRSHRRTLKSIEAVKIRRIVEASGCGAWRAGSMVRHAPIHRRSGHSDIAICCGRNVRGSSPSTSVVPLSNQVTTLNHKRFKGFKMFS